MSSRSTQHDRSSLRRFTHSIEARIHQFTGRWSLSNRRNQSPLPTCNDANAGMHMHQSRSTSVLPVTTVNRSTYRDTFSTSRRETGRADRLQCRVPEDSPDTFSPRTPPRPTPNSNRPSHLSPQHQWNNASADVYNSIPSPPVTIAVMGATGSGKSSFINLASGSSLRIGMSLESSTAEVQLSDEFIVDGKRTILIDTPGFDDTSKSDADILKLIAAFLATSYEKGSKLSGIIYVHRISDKRFTGTAARNFNMFRELCGDTALRNVVIVTNMWGEVSPEDGLDRENQLSSKFFKPVLDLGAQMARHYNSTRSAHEIIRRILKNRPMPLRIQRELVDEHLDIANTAAGNAVNRELNEQRKRHRDELRGVEEEIEQAMREQDEETRQELEEDRRRLQEQMDKVRQDSERMALDYAAEKEKLAAKMKGMRQ